jgi:Rrf2 family protein
VFDRSLDLASELLMSPMLINSITTIEFMAYSNVMKISQKGLYALQAMMMLARHYNQGAIRIRDIAYEETLPEKFLELILLELKNARMVESVRGAKGGYQLRRAPSEIHLSEIIRLIDGPLAPFGDADQLRTLIDRDAEHRALYQVFLAVRDAAAKILEHTTLADIMNGQGANASKSGKRRKKKGEPSSLLPMVVHGNPSRGKDE